MVDTTEVPSHRQMAVRTVKSVAAVLSTIALTIDAEQVFLHGAPMTVERGIVALIALAVLIMALL